MVVCLHMGLVTYVRRKAVTGASVCVPVTSLSRKRLRETTRRSNVLASEVRRGTVLGGVRVMWVDEPVQNGQRVVRMHLEDGQAVGRLEAQRRPRAKHLRAGPGRVGREQPGDVERPAGGMRQADPRQRLQAAGRADTVLPEEPCDSGSWVRSKCPPRIGRAECACLGY